MSEVISRSSTVPQSKEEEVGDSKLVGVRGSIPGSVESPITSPAEPGAVNLEPKGTRSRRSSSLDSQIVWEPSMADDGRCVMLNGLPGPNDERFISNYVKTARYEWWNMVCVVTCLSLAPKKIPNSTLTCHCNCHTPSPLLMDRENTSNT